MGIEASLYHMPFLENEVIRLIKRHISSMRELEPHGMLDFQDFDWQRFENITRTSDDGFHRVFRRLMVDYWAFDATLASLSPLPQELIDEITTRQELYFMFLNFATKAGRDMSTEVQAAARRQALLNETIYIVNTETRQPLDEKNWWWQQMDSFTQRSSNWQTAHNSMSPETRTEDALGSQLRGVTNTNGLRRGAISGPSNPQNNANVAGRQATSAVPGPSRSGNNVEDNTEVEGGWQMVLPVRRRRI